MKSYNGVGTGLVSGLLLHCPMSIKRWLSVAVGGCHATRHHVIARHPPLHPPKTFPQALPPKAKRAKAPSTDGPIIVDMARHKQNVLQCEKSKIIGPARRQQSRTSALCDANLQSEILANLIARNLPKVSMPFKNGGPSA